MTDGDGDGGGAGAGPPRRQLEGLLTGFDFYVHRERLRDDDRLVREWACHALADAADAVRRVESALRRAIPSPTPHEPMPPAQDLGRLRDIGNLYRAVSDAEALVRAQPYPHTDRIWGRLRNEEALLELVLEHDLSLINAAEAVRAAAEALSAAPESGALTAVQRALDRCERALAERAFALDLSAGS